MELSITLQLILHFIFQKKNNFYFLPHNLTSIDYWLCYQTDFFHSVKMQNVTDIHYLHKSAALIRNIFAIFNFCKPMLTLQFLLLPFWNFFFNL